ncbi:flagellar protein FlaG [Fredinandcohnia quinoae]|uniref:Flagellar protein FlaG n=1 Tax=Fredinandcohnia quinoae TaxID=2918902 RepID=A0AAW5E8F9_9BACI|nr:flagellar protein FlaG [Fredinandcohnia sp. SECRCQ15]MCH1625059.1 flagellar protein FlaG [Fredinandcohnia sp. SECRCQ15]
MGSVDSIFNHSIGSISVQGVNNVTTNSLEERQYNLDQQPKSNTQQENVNEKEFNEKDLSQVINDMNQVLGNTHTTLKYEYHEKLGKYYVSLVNDLTKEVVKEIPPKKLLDMYASMKEFLGLFVDNKI